MPKFRAVFISPIVPSGTGNGLAMRMGLFVEALSRIARVDVIVVPVAGEPKDEISFLQERGVSLHWINIRGRTDTHFSLLSRIANGLARLDAFRAYGKPSIARALSAPVLTDIARVIEICKPDLIHIGRSYLLPCIAQSPQGIAATVDLDEDDLSSFASQARLARLRGDLTSADWLEQEGRACDALIARFGRNFRRAYVASRRESLRLTQRHPGLRCEVLHNAVEIPPRKPRRDNGKTLLFIGALQYYPNSDGIIWFAQKVLPFLRAPAGGACRLLIAGASPPPGVVALTRHPSVTVLGRVKSVATLYQHATLALAPLHAGGGTRIKLLEAAAHRVASVSTPVAAQGSTGHRRSAAGARRGREISIRACHMALDNAAERDRRAAQAQSSVRAHHAKERVVKGLAQSLLAAADDAPAPTR
jgi:glycosyltransferase involved in cell wall biosynthesis